MANIKHIAFDELKEVVKCRIAEEADHEDFDNWFEKRVSDSEFMLYEWLGEAILNNYFRYLELKSNISK